MGRKNLEKLRTQQLLEAFMQCIPEYGIDGTTLERVAEKAGVTRSIIRHYIGNRDVLIEVILDHVIETSLNDFDQALADPTKNFVDRLSEALFAPRSDWQIDKLVINELINAKERAPEIQKKVTTLLEQMIAKIAQELQNEFPKCDPAAAKKVAYTLFCISFSQDSLVWLGIDPSLTGYGPEITKQIIAAWIVMEEK